MRSPHRPYEKSYPQELEVFKKQKNESWAEKNIRTYNNSVHLVDLFVSKLITILDDKIKGRYHLFFLSDHGEAMGEGGRFGHSGLWPEQYQIPLLYKRGTQDTMIDEQLRDSPEWHSIKEASQLIGYALGFYQDWRSKEKNPLVIGTEIEGRAGYLVLERTDTGFVIKERH